MPICQNCHETWTWWQAIKNTFRLICPYCRAKQYPSASTKKKSSYIYPIPIILIFLTNVLLDYTIGVGVLMLILLWGIMIGTLPFYLTLANEEEFCF